MAKIKIICDSAADIPAEIAKELDIRVMPLWYTFDGENYLADGIDLTKKEFFNKMREEKTVPKTSQVTAPQWEEAFREYVMELDKKKPVIICGDLNVAHNEIDLKNPKANRGSAGFSEEERGCFTKLLESGFTDIFRKRNPDLAGAYTWWSYRGNARANNTGWRIDYFLVSDRISDKVTSSMIFPEVLGSDHCPVGLEFEI